MYPALNKYKPKLHLKYMKKCFETIMTEPFKNNCKFKRSFPFYCIASFIYVYFGLNLML